MRVVCVASAVRLPTEELSDPYIDNFVAAHQQPHADWVGTGTQLENVLMVITRTRNHNCVVYRANMQSDTEWDMEDPIDMVSTKAIPVTNRLPGTFLTDCSCFQFWFDIAISGASSIETHRNSGQLDDFIPFGMFDAKGFGLKIDNYWRGLGEIVTSMVAMPDSLFAGGTAGADGAIGENTRNPLHRLICRVLRGRFVVADGKYGLLKPGQFKLVYVPEAEGPRLIHMLHGAQCYTEKVRSITAEVFVSAVVFPADERCDGLQMYVSTRERKFNPIPQVMYVRVYGIDVETGEHKHEDYYP